MRKLAQYAMRGNKQATMVAVLFPIIPVGASISAAIVALVILRKGYRDGAQVFMWSMLLPAIMWWVNGAPTPALTIVGVAVLASVLRYSASWAYVLVASLVIAILSVPILTSYLQVLLTDPVLAGVLTELLKLTENSDKKLLQSTVEGPFLAGYVVDLLACVTLARWWQAALFNRGGFQTEFHQLCLPLWLTGTLFLAVFGLSNVTDTTQWLFVLSIPLLFAGLALVHGLVEQLKLGQAWLFAIYLALLFLSAVVFPILALLATLDSVFKLRQYVPVRVKK